MRLAEPQPVGELDDSGQGLGGVRPEQQRVDRPVRRGNFNLLLDHAGPPVTLDSSPPKDKEKGGALSGKPILHWRFLLDDTEPATRCRFPNVTIWAMMGSRLLPMADRLYSTFGGTR